MTKAELRTIVRVMIGDSIGTRISDVALDLMIQMKADEIWSKVFSIEPYYIVNRQLNLTPTSPGYVDVSTGLTSRFYRLQSVGRAGQTYRQIDPRNVSFDDSTLMAIDSGSSSYRYFWRGTQLHLLPYATTADVDIEYSGPPASMLTSLTESQAIIWPDGHELALVLGTASAILRADKDLRTDADNALGELLAHVSRRSIGALTPYQVRTPQEDGAE